MPEHELGPVRALGWLREDRKPLLNAKLLVLGHLALNVYDPDNGYGEEVLDFEPRTVWWGSANWTVRAGSHLEVGFACDDPTLVEEASLYPQVCRLALLRQEGVDHARTEVGRLGDIDGDRSNRGPHRK